MQDRGRPIAPKWRDHHQQHRYVEEMRSEGAEERLRASGPPPGHRSMWRPSGTPSKPSTRPGPELRVRLGTEGVCVLSSVLHPCGRAHHRRLTRGEGQELQEMRETLPGDPPPRPRHLPEDATGTGSWNRASREPQAGDSRPAPLTGDRRASTPGCCQPG